MSFIKDVREMLAEGIEDYKNEDDPTVRVRTVVVAILLSSFIALVLFAIISLLWFIAKILVIPVLILALAYSVGATFKGWPLPFLSTFKKWAAKK